MYLGQLLEILLRAILSGLSGLGSLGGGYLFDLFARHRASVVQIKLWRRSTSSDAVTQNGRKYPGWNGAPVAQLMT
jgi:hypothetical protein